MTPSVHPSIHLQKNPSEWASECHPRFGIRSLPHHGKDRSWDSSSWPRKSLVQSNWLMVCLRFLQWGETSMNLSEVMVRHLSKGFEQNMSLHGIECRFQDTTCCCFVWDVWGSYAKFAKNSKSRDGVVQSAKVRGSKDSCKGFISKLMQVVLGFYLDTSLILSTLVYHDKIEFWICLNRT